MNKFQNIFAKSILIILGILVAYSAYHSFFILPGGNIWKSGGAGFTAVCIALCFFAICFFAACIQCVHKLDDRTIRKMILVVSVSIFILQCCWTVVVWKARVLPVTDLATDTTEAIHMLQTSRFEQNSAASIYPANRTHTMILFFYYRFLSWIGIDQFWEFSIILALICVDVSILFSCKIVKILSGAKAELIFLIACLLNPVTYLSLVYYYASVISLPCMMIAAYLILHILTEKRVKNINICAVLCGCVSAIGFYIRATAAFPLIAYIVYLICCTKTKDAWKQVCFRLIIMLGSFFLLIQCWSTVINHYDPYDRTDTAFPLTHGIMMSLQGQGGYVQSDVDYTASLNTKEKKIEGNIEVIKKRLKEMGIPGYFVLLGNKIRFNWSEGYARFTNWYGEDFRYVSGNRRDALILYSQIYRILLWIFILISIFLTLKQDDFGKDGLFLIIMLGAFATHIITEANPQYSVPFQLTMTISAVIGGTKLWECTKQNNYLKFLCIRKTMLFWGLMQFVIIFVFCVECYPNFTEFLWNRTDIASAQTYRRGSISNVSSSQLTIKQIFATNKPFNMLQIGVSGRDLDIVEPKYLMLLKCGDDIICQEEFGSLKVDESGRWITFSFDTVVPNGFRSYEIIILPLPGKISDSISFSIEKNKLDYAAEGELFINEKLCDDGDMTYVAGNRYDSPIYGKRGYFIQCAVILGLCIFCLVFFALSIPKPGTIVDEMQ